MGDTYQSVGPRRYLDRFLAEYSLREEDVRDRIKVDTPEPWLSGATPEEEYFGTRVPASLAWRFPCAGDKAALAFCEEIAEEMVRAFGTLTPRRWHVSTGNGPEPGPSGRVPRIWIVGRDLAYHQTPDDWAGDIYYGKGSRWSHPEHTPGRYRRPDEHSAAVRSTGFGRDGPEGAS